MLAPTLEVLNRVETFLEAVLDTLDIIVCTWCHLEPVLRNVGDNLLVLNLCDKVLLSTTFGLFLISLLFFFFRLQLEMTEKIEILVFGVASWWDNKLFADDLLDFLSGDGLCVKEGDRNIEKGLVASLWGSCLSISLIEVHCHNLAHITVGIKLFKSLDHVLN